MTNPSQIKEAYFVDFYRHMNDNNSVPARIVIVGTSTMKLSDRFNQIGLDGDSNKSFPAVGRNRPAAQSADFGGPLGIMASDRVIEPRSFLYDDYMGNDLFGTGSRAPPSTVYRRNGGGNVPRGRDNYAESYDDVYDDEPPVQRHLDMPIDDYGSPRYGRGRRGYGTSRQNRNRGVGGERYVLVPANATVTPSPRRRFRSARAAHSTPVQEIYEYYEPVPRPMAKPKAKVINVPIQNRISFKRLPRTPTTPRFRGGPVGGRSFRRNASASPIKKTGTLRGMNMANRRRNIAQNNKFKGRIAKKGGKTPMGRRHKQIEDPRKKLSANELDRELESYMRSGKHPRIEPVN